MSKSFYIKTEVNKSGITSIRIAINHATESGYQRDKKGGFVPAWFIQSLTIKSDDRMLLEAQLGPHLVKNPILAIRVRNLPKGSPLLIEWQDNKGEKFEQLAQVS